MVTLVALKEGEERWALTSALCLALQHRHRTLLQCSPRAQRASLAAVLAPGPPDDELNTPNKENG